MQYVPALRASTGPACHAARNKPAAEHWRYEHLKGSNMGLGRRLKVAMGFKSGRLAIARIAKANDDELILSDGISIKIQDEWRPNLRFPKEKDSGKIRYQKQDTTGIDAYTILKHGRFTGIIVYVHPDGDKFATHVLGGNPPMGWQGGSHIDYCKEVMAGEFGALAEFAMALND
ncbi:hypothetical protein QQM79_21050 [Marinobacteraceae bacterium S3BR75-40.1]